MPTELQQSAHQAVFRFIILTSVTSELPQLPLIVDLNVTCVFHFGVF